VSPRENPAFQAPAQREISIAQRQRPNGVKVVRKHANRNRLEWMAFSNRRVDSPKPTDLPNENVTRFIGERDTKEENAATHPRHHRKCPIKSLALCTGTMRSFSERLQDPVG
jgi:hypothetical protein